MSGDQAIQPHKRISMGIEDLQRVYQKAVEAFGTTMRRDIPVIQFSQNVSDSDLAKIRKDAGNQELTADDVSIFGKSMMARSDVVASRTWFDLAHSRMA